ncbi:hypothetical protein NUK42_07155 [Aeromonas veronii]|uniref:hypothetical protein n=1 Tax=Aeromonas veronii TaxID=654 RepID=UPI00214E4162|nr:hypothetical protein [Aeromonas veronii]MCR3958524.1 hypothetical protein [Aeromonas veronii]
MKHQNDHIKFPSGNTVEFCRKKAKKLVKEKGIKLAQALDIIAELNGISGGWHNAMQQLNNKPQPSAVISAKLPEKLEKLFEKIDVAMPNLPDHVEQLIRSAAMPKLPDNIEQLIRDAAIPQLPENIEQLIRDAAIPQLPENIEQLIRDAAMPKLPDHVEQLIRGAAIPKLPDNIEQLIRDAAMPKLPDHVEQLIRSAAMPKLPGHVEQLLKTVDALVPRELREYQKTLKQFEDVVNKQFSDLRE